MTRLTLLLLAIILGGGSAYALAPRPVEDYPEYRAFTRYQDICFNGDLADKDIAEACWRRDQFYQTLVRYGFCWGPDDVIETQKHWSRCVSPQ